ncbi:hypothetical protein POM88_007305 [Heracleum sosnowskyi]|uniref:Uncharacterized protein n=1 Tax=Heracleum sosnowskyi TaxID=360622 RepID=A0AAD8N651_9APIA|nr:hypothetical protein POM88_007305 [Heracleum sosnowskyi]
MTSPIEGFVGVQFKFLVERIWIKGFFDLGWFKFRRGLLRLRAFSMCYNAPSLFSVSTYCSGKCKDLRQIIREKIWEGKIQGVSFFQLKVEEAKYQLDELVYWKEVPKANSQHGCYKKGLSKKKDFLDTPPRFPPRPPRDEEPPGFRPRAPKPGNVAIEILSDALEGVP